MSCRVAAAGSSSKKLVRSSGAIALRIAATSSCPIALSRASCWSSLRYSKAAAACRRGRHRKTSTRYPGGRPARSDARSLEGQFLSRSRSAGKSRARIVCASWTSSGSFIAVPRLEWRRSIEGSRGCGQRAFAWKACGSRYPPGTGIGRGRSPRGERLRAVERAREERRRIEAGSVAGPRRPAETRLAGETGHGGAPMGTLLSPRVESSASSQGIFLEPSGSLPELRRCVYRRVACPE